MNHKHERLRDRLNLRNCLRTNENLKAQRRVSRLRSVGAWPMGCFQCRSQRTFTVVAKYVRWGRLYMLVRCRICGAEASRFRRLLE